MPSCLPFFKLSLKRPRYLRHKTFSVDQNSDSGSSNPNKALASAPSPSHLNGKDLLCNPGPLHSSDSLLNPNVTPNHTHLKQSASSGTRSSDLWVFTYVELRAATRSFSRSYLLGEGGFGRVYKGQIKCLNSNGQDYLMDVAVKQLKQEGQQGHKEWLAEVRILAMVEHPNLVKLIGYCAEDYERGIQRLLVYEYMTNGSLEIHLFSKGGSVLPWQRRLRILLGAARGLAYLHEEIDGTQIIFRDFKTSNVLLDHAFTPRLSDFGMARQGPELGESHVSTAVVGTLGYAAPEYIQTGHLTSKSDVWSFGVVLLEMLSGRRCLDRSLPKGEKQLMDLAKPYLQGNKKVQNIMDPRLEGDYSVTQALGIVTLAQQCLHRHARSRPPMSDVVEKLKEILGSCDDMLDESVHPAHTQSESDVKKQGRPSRKCCFI